MDTSRMILFVVVGFLTFTLMSANEERQQNVTLSSGSLLPLDPLVVATSTSKVMGSSTERSQCTCNVMTTDWSEFAMYRKLGEMRQKLKDSEAAIKFMNFSAIFSRLENITTRLDNLEAHINEQGVRTTITELFALQTKVTALRSIVKSANDSSLLVTQIAHLKQELDAVTNVTEELWNRNPYKQRDEYKEQLATLRDATAVCQTNVDSSPFPGDKLPLNMELSKGWCPSNGSAFILGNPITHKWNKQSDYATWFKDPHPLTNGSRTEIWNIGKTTSTTQSQRGFYRQSRPTTSTTPLHSFSTYAKFVNDIEVIRTKPKSISDGGAVLFRNSFYYGNGNNLKKVDISTGVETSVSMSFTHVSYKGSTSAFLDLNVDESGLWVVYCISTDNKIAISKLDPNTLVVKKTWITGITKPSVCAVFIVCGRLYTVSSCTSRLAPNDMNYMYDTATSRDHFVRFYVRSMYGSITQLTYNPREKMLFAWDNQHMVTYPVGWKK